jgi:hypothetical protein
MPRSQLHTILYGQYSNVSVFGQNAKFLLQYWRSSNTIQTTNLQHVCLLKIFVVIPCFDSLFVIRILILILILGVHNKLWKNGNKRA